MKKLLIVTLGLIIYLPLAAWAVTVPNLYNAEVPVSSQGNDERAQAVKLAFSQLLVRLTGNSEIEEDPDIAEAVKRADYYVQEFSYSSPTTASATYSIHITFERDDVNRLLRRAGIPYWGEERPLILVWLAVTNKAHVTEIVGNETPGDILDAMRYESRKFALPLIFPLMDVTDMSQVSPNEISTMVLPVLKQAGKRYSPNAYLIGKIEANGDGYSSEWQLVLNKDSWTWSVAEKTTDAVIAEALLQASQVLTKRFHVRS